MHAHAFFKFSNQRNVVYRVDKSLALAAVRDMRKDEDVLEKGLQLARLDFIFDCAKFDAVARRLTPHKRRSMPVGIVF